MRGSSRWARGIRVSVAALPQLHTFEEFCELIEDGQKADLLDGIIYMASPDTLRNNDIQNFLYVLIKGFAERHQLGRAFTSRVACRLGKRNGPEPDVLFVSRENAERLKPTHVAGAPDLVVEIVSDDSVERDYIKKRVVYETAGVAEYWIVDPERETVLLLGLVDGEFHEKPIESGILRSSVLPGFWLDVKWLFSEPMPNTFECLQQILAGEAAK